MIKDLSSPSVQAFMRMVWVRRGRVTVISISPMLLPERYRFSKYRMALPDPGLRLS
jgi:hypothetical protein